MMSKLPYTESYWLEATNTEYYTPSKMCSKYEKEEDTKDNIYYFNQTHTTKIQYKTSL